MNEYEKVERLENELKRLQAEEQDARSQQLTGLVESLHKQAAEKMKELASARRAALEAPFTAAETELIKAALDKVQRGEVSKAQARAKIRELEDTVTRQEKLIARYGRSFDERDRQVAARAEAEKFRLMRLIRMYEYVLEHGEFQKGKRR